MGSKVNIKFTRLVQKLFQPIFLVSLLLLHLSNLLKLTKQWLGRSDVITVNIFVVYSYNAYSLATHYLKNEELISKKSNRYLLYIIHNHPFSKYLEVQATPLEIHANAIMQAIGKRAVLSEVELVYHLINAIVNLRKVVIWLPHENPMGFLNLTYYIKFFPSSIVRFYDDGLSGSIKSSLTRKFLPNNYKLSLSWNYFERSPKYNTDIGYLLKLQSCKFLPENEHVFINPEYKLLQKFHLLDISYMDEMSNINDYATDKLSSLNIVCILDSNYIDMDILNRQLRLLARQDIIFHYLHPVKRKRVQIDPDVVCNLSNYFVLDSLIPEEHIIYLLDSGCMVTLYSGFSSVPLFLCSLIGRALTPIKYHFRFVNICLQQSGMHINEELSEFIALSRGL